LLEINVVAEFVWRHIRARTTPRALLSVYIGKPRSKTGGALAASPKPAAAVLRDIQARQELLERLLRCVHCGKAVPDVLLSTKALAAMTGRHPRSWENKRCSGFGGIPYVKLGDGKNAAVGYWLSTILAHLESCTRQHTSEPSRATNSPANVTTTGAALPPTGSNDTELERLQRMVAQLANQLNDALKGQTET
jgi:hypothetical protein